MIVTTSDDYMASLQVFFENIVVSPTTRRMSMLLATDQTKIYISLFTIKIKKETRGGLSVRVFLHLFVSN